MVSLRNAHFAHLRVAAGVFVAFCTLAALHPVPAWAAPTRSAVQTFSVEASATSVTTTEAVGYTATIRMRAATPSVRVRLRIYTSDGRLLYQKTEYVSAAKRGTVRVGLARPSSGHAMDEGSYRVEVSVKSNDMAEPFTRVLPLRVYSTKSVPVSLVVCARVTGPPMTDPQGRFVVDPDQANAAFEAAVQAADLVLGDARVRLSLALSPVLLGEWEQVTAGYQLIDETGVTSVATSAPAPQRYSAGLERLRGAVATGRLELLSVGFADPNLSWLTRAGLAGDIVPQYRYGTRETSGALAAAPVAGTMVAGSGLTDAAVASVEQAGVRWIVLGERYVRLGRSVPLSGAYRTTEPSLRAVVADATASRALRAGNPDPTLAGAFGRFLLTGTSTGSDIERAVTRKNPFVVTIDVGPGLGEISSVAELLGELDKAPWAVLANTRQAFANASGWRLSFVDVVAPDRAPAGYWDEVEKADQAALALASALSPSAPDAVEARTDALIAESSGFAGPDRSWALADRGRAFSAAASRLGRVILGGVRLSAPNVTLSGSAGEVPVTITNPTKRVLKVVFLALDTGEVVRSGGRREVLLRPGDTYLTLKVDLRTSLSTTLRLAVRAGGTNLDTDVVMIRASYLDRLAIIGGVLVLLIALLAFIVVRVRSAEPVGRHGPGRSASHEVPLDTVQGAADDVEGSYTEESSGEHDSKVSDGL